MNIIPETHRADHDESNQERQILLEPETWILKHLPSKPNQHRDGKYHSATPQHDGRVTTSLVRFIDNITLIRNLKIRQFCNK